jgi:hypothetical protein
MVHGSALQRAQAAVDLRWISDDQGLARSGPAQPFEDPTCDAVFAPHVHDHGWAVANDEAGDQTRLAGTRRFDSYVRECIEEIGRVRRV